MNIKNKMMIWYMIVFPAGIMLTLSVIVGKMELWEEMLAVIGITIVAVGIIMGFYYREKLLIEEGIISEKKLRKWQREER